MTSSDETPFYAECRRCGERWLLAVGFIPLAQLAEPCRCPNCGMGKKEVFICPTHGQNAVAEPRKGKPMAKIGGDHGR